MKRIYLDTAPVIYEVEHSSVTVPAALHAAGIPSFILVASDMTRLECRVKPLRERDEVLLRDYDDFFSESVSEIVPLSRNMMDGATEIRAQHGFRTPDAIHLAAALASGCDVVLTNDLRLARFTGLDMVVINELQP